VGAPLAGVSLTIDAGRLPLDAFVAQAAPEIRRVAEELTRAMRHSAGTIGVGSV
jgi:IclR family pca regulon transcriptional regulator